MTKDDKVNPLKILLVGDAGTGKTNLLSQLTRNEFDLNAAPTTGVNMDTHDMLINNNTVKAEIWDLAGREKYRAMANSYFFHDAAGILLVYDMSNAATFENVTGWLKDITKLADPKTVVKLVGNKSDLEHQRMVPIERAEQFATDNGLSFIEMSGLDGSNVKMTFECMVNDICATMASASRNSDDCLFSTCSFISNRMKKNNQVEHFSDSSSDDTQPHEQQQPFHIVLVDIKWAANGEIHCVEKPLLEDDLKYVALSYRWGELQETAIDTKIDYTAVVKSFDLKHFQELCYSMTREADLKDIDYVWVDAICIDQTNYERRKATIYQMSNIYEQASYIVAVPDLHAAHLKDTSTSHREIMTASLKYNSDIYHLIHGNTDQLAHIEKRWLDYFKVPEDPALRQLLTSSTNYFVDGFMKYRHRHYYYNAEEILDHLYQTNQRATTDNNNDFDRTQAQMDGINRMHDCNQVDCPLDFVGDEVPEWRVKILYEENRCLDLRWKQLLQERGTRIKQSMDFMGDLIVDWSSRVWVISEYSIARKNNNMKYWFIQLGKNIDCGDEDFTFFKFDFDDLAFSAAIQDALAPRRSYSVRSEHDPPYSKFHQTMLTQLNQQSFFEMLLKSRASRNEDRFYAIFPQSEYKSKIENKVAVDSWKIDTLLSVKLKLFEVMTTKDKLNFLFLSSHYKANNLGETLPTFATSTISWSAPMEHFTHNDRLNPSDYNFDLTSPSAITLCQSHENDNHSPPLPYLNLKPMEYIVDSDCIQRRKTGSNQSVWSCLQSEDPLDTNVVVYILNMKKAPLVRERQFVIRNNNHVICLNGNFEKNIWTIEHPDITVFYRSNFENCVTHRGDDHSAGFNIY